MTQEKLDSGEINCETEHLHRLNDLMPAIKGTMAFSQSIIITIQVKEIKIKIHLGFKMPW